MPDDSHLPRQYNPVTDLGGAGYPYLRYNNAVAAYFNVVGNLNKVIDFRPAPDASRPQGSTVYRSVGTDLHLIFDLNPADLLDFLKAAFRLGKAEPVRANHG